MSETETEHESKRKVPAFSVTASETSPVVRSLAIEVEQAGVTDAFEKAYKELGKSVRLKGFRPGKAPRAVLERVYGASIQEEVERQLVGLTFVAAVEREGIFPVLEPQIEAEPPRAGQVFRYTAQVEVKPAVALPDLEGLPATRPAASVTEEEVEAEVESLRQRRAPVEDEPEGTAAARGSIVTLDYAGSIDGELFEGGTAEAAQVELGSGRLVPGFEEGLEGARVGESREVRVTFPEDYPAEELRGKAAVFATQVKALQRRAISALDDAFAKSIGEEGIETLDQLSAKIREAMEKRREHDADEALHRSLVDALIERTPFEVPGGLVDRRLSQRLQSAHQQLESVLPHDELHARLDEWRETWRDDAQRDVKESLLLEAVAEQEKLEVADAELSERVEQMAHEQGMAPKRLQELYTERGLMDGLRARMRDEKALEFLTSKAKVEATSGT
jgi:trigger factor